jgi:quercetin dioxygenase-like cupin family protein
MGLIILLRSIHSPRRLLKGGEDLLKFVSFQQDTEQTQIGGMNVGGVTIQGQGLLRITMTGALGQLTEIYLKKGYYHPEHKHIDEESIGYVVKGHLIMGIGSQEYVLRDGDSWCHPDGVFHWTRAVEDTYALEMHCPPRPIKSYDR